MEGPGQTAAVELACDLPVLASSPETRFGTDAIEAEVMTLFEQYRAPLLRYAGSFGVPIADAEEIVQEVFLSLFKHLLLRRSRENLRGWIFRVAHNLTLKQRHANKRLLDHVVNDLHIAALHADPSPTPERSCSDLENQRRLLAVVRSLSELEQNCLRMRAEGLQYREIAKALGISLGSVSTHLTRALAKLTRVDRR